MKVKMTKINGVDFIDPSKTNNEIKKDILSESAKYFAENSSDDFLRWVRNIVNKIQNIGLPKGYGGYPMRNILNHLNEQYTDKYLILPFAIGDKVIDSLTRKESVVIGIQYEDGVVISDSKHYSVKTWAIFIDSNFLDGARHPWEIEKVKTRKEG